MVAGLAVPSELTAASRVPSGHASGRSGSRSRVSPASMSGCGRAHPVPGGIVPVAIARAALIRLAIPVAALE